MSANNQLVIEKLQDGKYWVSEIDVDGESGHLLREEPYKSMEEAVKAANEYMNKYPVEYGIVFTGIE